MLAKRQINEIVLCVYCFYDNFFEKLRDGKNGENYVCRKRNTERWVTPHCDKNQFLELLKIKFI